MPEVSHICPKCNGAMEQGFIIDQIYGGRVIGYWAAGSPQKSIWTGTKLPEEKLVPIGTFCCASCGYLESFALPEFAPK